MDPAEAEERLAALDRKQGFVRVIGERDFRLGRSRLTLLLCSQFSIRMRFTGADRGAETSSASLFGAGAAAFLPGPEQADVASQLARCKPLLIENCEQSSSVA